MRIEKLTLKGVGPFEHLELDFPEGSDPDRADVYLLVGPNGSGKSTLLYALAQILTEQDTPIKPRIWGALSAISAHVNGREYTLTLEAWGVDWLARFFRDEGVPIAFGYSSHRSVGSGQIDSVREQEFVPLSDTLTFNAVPASGLLVQWLANTMTKRALALVRGDTAAADRRQASVTRIETALTRVTNRSVKFGMSEEPLGVTLEWQGATVDLGVLPEGLKSILSWLGDLLMRLEALPSDDLPITDRPFVLFLDEVEVHLHPLWQRRLVPMLQELFPNAQLFLATHSPFIVASADDAFIYPLALDDAGRATCGEVLTSRRGHSYPAILEEVFGVPWEFDDATERQLQKFRDLRDRRLQGEPVDDELKAKAQEIAGQSVELRDIVAREMRALKRRLDRAG